jgi:cell wall-associated NlpC family hydrolase
MTTNKARRFAALILSLGLLLGAFSALAAERYQVIMYGDKDEYVERLQEELYARGYLKTKPTGYFGKETLAALIRYQERNDLTADGIAGIATQKKIFGKYYEPIPQTRQVSGAATEEEAADRSTSLRLGDEDERVSQIQTRLKELGYYTHSKITEYFGPLTEEALTAFQQQNGLHADGVYGSKTREVLFSRKAVPASEARAVDNTTDEEAGSALIPEEEVIELELASEDTPDTQLLLDVSSTQSFEGQIRAQMAIETARSLQGIRYRLGGRSPETGFDCSGLIYYLLKQQDLGTPRTSKEMSRYEKWPQISKSNLMPGDLVFFSNSGSGGDVGHVGMYIGNGQFIHSSSGSAKSVTISSLSADYYEEHYLGARRCFE